MFLKTRVSTLLLAMIALIAWTTLVLQFYLQMQSTVAPRTELVIRFFSFFTVLSNLLVAIVSTGLLFAGAGNTAPKETGTRRDDGPSRPAFFRRQGVLTAIAVYIFIVFLIYNTVLRFLWHPTGLSRWLDESLHVVVPVLYVLFWYSCVRKRRLPARSILPWLLFPVAYIGYVLLRGRPSGFYPYPFVDVTRLGIRQVLINSAGVAVAFMLVSLAFLGVGNGQAKRASANS